ncbi:MAG: RNA polymerase sigma-70 factor [Sphingobacteriaceae bacterium]|nr:MAG: RNA polymerase sigma-70 factor [Sphingobacteriaceae bacterium]
MFFSNIASNQLPQPIKRFNNYSDQELILLWQDGDDSAFEHLYLKYSVQLLAIAVQKTNDREFSKELVQTIFISLYNNKETAHQIRSLMAYLYTGLKNRILDHHKHNLIHKKFQSYSAQYYPDIANNTDALSYIETKELEQRLADEINKLPAQCGNVFRLRRQKDMSNREIAAELNISVKTVEQHMTRALRLLKAVFFQIK